MEKRKPSIRMRSKKRQKIVTYWRSWRRSTSNGILSVGINALSVVVVAVIAADDDVDVAYHMDIDTILKIKKKNQKKKKPERRLMKNGDNKSVYA